MDKLQFNDLMVGARVLAKVQLLVEGDYGVLINLIIDDQNNRYATCSTHVGVKFSWDDRQGRLYLTATLGAMDIALGFSAEDLTEITK